MTENQALLIDLGYKYGLSENGRETGRLREAASILGKEENIPDWADYFFKGIDKAQEVRDVLSNWDRRYKGVDYEPMTDTFSAYVWGVSEDWFDTDTYKMLEGKGFPTVKEALADLEIRTQEDWKMRVAKG